MSAAALPALREELNLFAGGPGADGAPTWNLHDPVRNQFFLIDWPTFEILARWSLKAPADVAAAVSNDTTLEIQAADVEAVQGFLADNQLLQLHHASGSQWLMNHEQALRNSLWQWLIHHYLFFRIPLVRPDRWLTRHLPYVRLFYSKRFFQLTAVVLLIGLFECYRQWTHFATALVDSFTFKGVAAYAIALTFVKVMHELGHAFTAKRKGCRVPTMGIAFLVMWPVAYTDVNEVWKLSRRADRLAVGAAGIVAELLIAAWATCAWALLPDGGLRSIALLLATTTWISTLAINASPFMRFDGYFLLSDFLSLPNLHARAFALARWDLRERLFALGEPPPEFFSPARTRGLILFAWLVWLYRLALFLAIAVLVYHFFFKLLGIVLFTVEIGVFVIQPIWREISAWRTRTVAIRNSRRARVSLVLAGAVLLIGFVPWNGHVNGQGVMRTAQYFSLYAASPARIGALPGHNGSRLEAGALLVKLESPDLDYRQQQIQAHLQRLKWQMEVSGMDADTRANQAVTREELVGAQTELTGVLHERQRFEIRAPFAGVLVDVGPELRKGVWVNRQERLGVLIDPRHWLVETYLEESEIKRVRLGDSARFFGEQSGMNPLRMRVVRIDPDATRQLHDLMLTVPHGGQIQARERNGLLIPDKALYRIVLQLPSDELTTVNTPAQRGQVVIDGGRKSLFGDYLRAAASVFIREAGW